MVSFVLKNDGNGGKYNFISGKKISCDQVKVKGACFQVEFDPFYGFFYRVNHLRL